MRSKFKWIFTLLVALSMQFSFAQERTITGVVSGIKGPLSNSTITIKGTKRSAQSDNDGKYSIKANTSDVLVFSFVGFKSVQVAVGGSNTVNARINEIEAEQLADVIVNVAYSTQKKSSITGAVTAISADVISNQQVTSPLRALQGTVAGLNIITAGGQPGNNPEIRIRGFSSLSANASPLIVMDGAPFNGNLNSISQDQIESLTVLKDASSTSPYGSRGANGVILITTKRGKKNTQKVNFRTQIGVSNLAVGLHKTVGTEDLMKYTWEAIKNTNITAGQSQTLASTNASASLIDRLGYNPYGTVSQPINSSGNLVPGAELLWETNWQSEILRKSAVRTNHSFDVSGGSEKNTYFFSLDYLNEQGPVNTSLFERISTRLNVDSKVNDWFKVGFNTGFTYSNSGNPDQTSGSTTQAIGWIYNLSSIYPLYRRNANGSLFLDAKGNQAFDYGDITGQAVNGRRPQSGGENAVATLFLNKDRDRRTSVLLSGFAEVKLYDWLTFKTRLNYENYLFDQFSFDDDLFGAAALPAVKGRVTQNRNIITTLNAVNGFHAIKSFGNHNLALDLMAEAYSFERDDLRAQGIGFLPDISNLGSSTSPEGVGGVVVQERINSYLGRLKYDYNDKYFIEGSVRRDGSTRFSRDVRWGTFYSVGGAWMVSNESFLKNNKYINELKLRASYGEVGNGDLGASYFPYQSVYESGFSNQGNPGTILTSLNDINISWEKTASSNFGLDFSLFDDRISGTIDYYKKTSIDLILNKPLARSLGFPSITTNIGAVENSGVELTINTNNFRGKDFSWRTSFNISQNNNVVTKLLGDGKPIIQGTKQWEIGRSIFDFFIAEWAGVDPGDGNAMWYRDVLTNGVVTSRETTKVFNEATRGYHGSSLPKFEGGLTNTFKFQQFDLNIIFNYSLGGKILDTDYSSLINNFASSGANAHPDTVNRWQNPGDITDFPKLSIGNNEANSQSTRFLFNNDYVRLKSLMFGYSLPSSAFKSNGLSNVRFFIQAENLLTFQSHKGIDPEQSFGGLTARRSPQFRTVSGGVSISF